METETEVQAPRPAKKRGRKKKAPEAQLVQVPAQTVLTAASLMDAISRSNVELREKAADFFSEFYSAGPEKLASVGRLLPVPGREDYFTAPLWDGWLAVLCNPVSTIWVFAWVGKEESVRRFIQENLIEANPRVGSIQIYRKFSGAEGDLPKAAEVGPFAELSDADLLDIGVPACRVALVRSIQDGSRLESIREYLPPDTFICLRRLAAGFTSGRRKVSCFQKMPPASAFLENPETRSQFVQTADVESFREAIRLPLEKWRCFLSEEQRRMVESPRKGSFMVTGAAGTGKTVVALHRARYLVSLPDWKRSDKLLLTTFTRSLAADLRQQLAKILPEERIRDCIEVVNLHEWVRDFLNENGVTQEFLCDGPELDGIWASAARIFPGALGRKKRLPESFFRNEFEHVVMPDRIRTEAEYLAADRTGRGSTLGRQERRIVWPVFEYVRKEIAKTGKLAIQDAFYAAIDLIASGAVKKRYRAIVVDEAQDFSNEAFRLMRALTPDISLSKTKTLREGDIFLTGDEGQRIFNRGNDLSSCGINVRSKRTRKLTLNYRTTAEIREAGLVVLENDPAKQAESKEKRLPYADPFCTSPRAGALPELYAGKGLEDEVRWIVSQIVALQNTDRAYRLSDFVVAAHSNERRDEYLKALRARGIAAVALDKEELPPGDAVRVSTLHRLKGLEFKAVFISGADEGKMPSASALARAAESLEERNGDQMQRSLFYVAATRARDRLFISCREAPGAFMRAVAGYFDIKL